MERESAHRVHIVEKNNAHVASIAKLPNELLAEVFYLAHQPLIFDEPEGDQQTLTSIASVCSLWREVALSISGLWSHVVWSFSDHCRDAPSTSPKIERRCSRISEYLIRSRSSPISLYLNFGGNSWGTIRRVWRIVSAHLSRCCSLSVVVSNSGELHNILPIPGQLTQLESLDIQMLHGGLLGTTLFAPETASPLRRLALRQITITGDEQPAWSDYLPIHALRSVSVRTSGRALQSALDLLAQCPHLLDLNITVDAKTSPTYLHAVTFPELEELSIPDSYTFVFARYIHAPKVQKITISHGFWELRPPSTFVTTSTNTYPSLRTLRVSRFTRSPHDSFLDFCRHHPTIEVLSIDSWWTAAEFIVNDLLTVDDEGDLDSLLTTTSNSAPVDQYTGSLASQGLTPALQSLRITGIGSPTHDRTLAPDRLVLYRRLLAQRPSLFLMLSWEYVSSATQQLEQDFPIRVLIAREAASLPLEESRRAAVTVHASSFGW